MAHTGVVDVDGTLTGSAGTYVTQPSMREGSCRDVRVAGVGDNVEVVLIGKRAADATLVLPWTASRVHVYAGWGEWAQPVEATVDGGAVRLQVAASAWPAGFYERWKVCAVKGCGDGTGSRRE